MGCCGFILKIGFLAFFALNGWNTLQNLNQHTTTFKNSYKNFETTLAARTGLQIPPQLHHAEISKHSEIIVKSLAWAQIGFSGASVLICGGFTWVVGLIYFLQQALHLNVASFTAKTSFADFEKLALAVGLLMGSFAVAGCSKACGKGKSCPVKPISNSSVNEQKSSQAKDKKRH